MVLWPGSTHSTSSGQVGAWHFVHVDKAQSAKIKEKYAGPRRGFGAVRVSVKIGKTTWQTSIFPDKRSGTYLLPLKAAVRRAEGIFEGETITFTLEI
ncbi:hypothetical protein A2853_04135 [Candidatus Kaiserbacteria bacterium RIFCSPHIGHO2_01_FULL_55_17]|uniref:DUF1905 domain-containing protein n=1 Tax=Candidatus Kaiserbacteria bacterium RIFCSPHIGHO2_01_FULL_55_17 TaxID=1798484 RepID=A0A1F6D8P4_9BACT|nr:MAG: hypothetical protein A2853_04135 [Candidatus Kaiserbacteria bacterium RIFCSPHIGHO2_01_FULL_55_17]